MKIENKNQYYDGVPEGKKRCGGDRNIDSGDPYPCRKMKPTVDFGKYSAALDGLQPLCKACTNAKRRDGKLKSQGIDPRTIPPGMKTCSGKLGCGHVFPVESFPLRKDGKPDHLCSSCAPKRVEAGLYQWENNFRKFHVCEPDEDGEEMRTCGWARSKKGGCGVKHLSDFAPDESTVDGVSELCKGCLKKKEEKNIAKLFRNGKPKIEMYFDINIARDMPHFESKEEACEWLADSFENELWSCAPTAIYNTATKLGLISKNNDGSFAGADAELEREETLPVEWILKVEDHIALRAAGRSLSDRSVIEECQKRIESYLSPNEKVEFKTKRSTARYNFLIRRAAEKSGVKQLRLRCFLTPAERLRASVDSPDEWNLVEKKLSTVLNGEKLAIFNGGDGAEFNKVIREGAAALGIDIPDWPFDEIEGDSYFLNHPRFWGGRLD